jgi:hypothetical protein
MQIIAEDLNFRMSSDSAFFAKFAKIGNLLGKHRLSGNLRGKHFTIRVTKFPNFSHFPLRLVVRTELKENLSCDIFASGKPFLPSLHKIFGKNMFFPDDVILDKRLLFSTKDTNFMKKLLSYEEIRDQFCDVWKTGRSPGTLIVGANAVIYHEPFRWITKSIRERVKNAANLMCDVVDVMELSPFECARNKILFGQK